MVSSNVQVMVNHQKRVDEAALMRGHNCLKKIKEIVFESSPASTPSAAMIFTPDTQRRSNIILTLIQRSDAASSPAWRRIDFVRDYFIRVYDPSTLFRLFKVKQLQNRENFTCKHTFHFKNNVIELFQVL